MMCGDLHDVDLITWRVLWLDCVGQSFSVRRPGGVFFRNVGRTGQRENLAIARRNQKDVPLLIAVGVGLVGDPAALGLPCRMSLALAAYRELHGPAAFRGHDPD